MDGDPPEPRLVRRRSTCASCGPTARSVRRSSCVTSALAINKRCWASLWAVLQPITAVLLFTAVFGQLAGLPSQGIPYAAFVFSGVLAWNYFNAAVSDASRSIVSDPNLVTKVHFPRMSALGAALVPPLVDLGIAFVAMIVVMAVTNTYVAGLAGRHDAAVAGPAVQRHAWGRPAGFGAARALPRHRPGHRPGDATVVLRHAHRVLGDIGAGRRARCPRLQPADCRSRRLSVGTGRRTPARAPGIPPSAGCVILVLGLGIVCFQHMARRFADVI